MNLQELVAETGTTPRQIRFMIAEGCVPAPRGGRANAEYGCDHVAAVQRYRHLREAGFPPAAIRLLLRDNTAVSFNVAPGVDVTVNPDRIAARTDARRIAEQARATIEQLLKEPENAARRTED